MKRKMFFGVTFAIFTFMIIAWQFATAEIAALQEENKNPSVTKSSELVHTHKNLSTSTAFLL